MASPYLVLTLTKRTHTHTHTHTKLDSLTSDHTGESNERIASEGARENEGCLLRAGANDEREMVGASVRTMLNMEVSTDGDQHQDQGGCGCRSMGERRRRTIV